MLNYHSVGQIETCFSTVHVAFYTLYRVTCTLPSVVTCTNSVLLVDSLQRSAVDLSSLRCHPSIHPSTPAGSGSLKGICAAPDGWHRSLSPANDTKVRVHIEDPPAEHLAVASRSTNTNCQHVHLQAEPHGVVHCQNGRHPPCFLPSAGIYFHF